MGNHLRKQLAWLLEPDPVNPGVRYFALTDLLGAVAAPRAVLNLELECPANWTVRAQVEVWRPERGRRREHVLHGLSATHGTANRHRHGSRHALRSRLAAVRLTPADAHKVRHPRD